MKERAATDTKTRILDAAELIFAERGFDAASLRAITAEAGVNLGAVNYHFTSKEALMHAVLARRLDPINARRLALLDACEQEPRGLPARLEPLVNAFVVPLLLLDGGESARLPSVTKLLGRLFAEPAGSVRKICAEQNKAVAARFVAAFKRALPDLSRAEIFWRLYLSIGIVVHVHASAPMAKLVSDGLCDAQDKDAINQRVINFILAGLQAPARIRMSGRASTKRKKIHAGSAGTLS